MLFSPEGFISLVDCDGGWGGWGGGEDRGFGLERIERGQRTPCITYGPPALFSRRTNLGSSGGSFVYCRFTLATIKMEVRFFFRHVQCTCTGLGQQKKWRLDFSLHMYNSTMVHTYYIVHTGLGQQKRELDFSVDLYCIELRQQSNGDWICVFFPGRKNRGGVYCIHTY